MKFRKDWEKDPSTSSKIKAMLMFWKRKKKLERDEKKYTFDPSFTGRYVEPMVTRPAKAQILDKGVLFTVPVNVDDARRILSRFGTVIIKFTDEDVILKIGEKKIEELHIDKETSIILARLSYGLLQSLGERNEELFPTIREG
jgi:hypothetical protein